MGKNLQSIGLMLQRTGNGTIQCNSGDTLGKAIHNIAKGSMHELFVSVTHTNYDMERVVRNAAFDINVSCFSLAIAFNQASAPVAL